jgi:putative endonuclease
MDSRKKFGQAGEELAEKFLISRGLKLLVRNFRTKVGEVDLIMRNSEEFIFVEVKARHGASAARIFEAVDESKLGKISAVAEEWLEQKKLQNVSWRIDLIFIEADKLRWIKGV